MSKKKENVSNETIKNEILENENQNVGWDENDATEENQTVSNENADAVNETAWNDNEEDKKPENDAKNEETDKEEDENQKNQDFKDKVKTKPIWNLKVVAKYNHGSFDKGCEYEISQKVFNEYNWLFKIL